MWLLSWCDFVLTTWYELQEVSNIITFFDVTCRLKYIDYDIGNLTLRAINWYINESILRGRLVGAHLGVLGNFGGFLQKFSGPLPSINKYNFGILSSSPVTPGTFAGWFDKRGGSGCLVTEMHGMPLSRPRRCVQADCQQLSPNMKFTHCIMHELREWSTKVLRQRFWLDLYTKQEVSAKLCANQFLPYDSSGIKLTDMKTVQAD